MSFRGDLSGRPEGFVPPRADGAKERRIDEQFAKRVDQGHVDRREATDAAHVDAKIEAVPVCRFDKGAQRCGVGGTVDQLKKLLVLEAVYDAEKSFARTAGARDLERSAVVMRVTKVSHAVAAGSRSQPNN